MKLNIDTDIDIDVLDRDTALALVQHVSAVGKGRRKHPSGVYFQNIPYDPETGLSSFGTSEAANYGFFKVDILNNTIYEGVRDSAHLDELVATEPDWNLFVNEDFTSKLAQLQNAGRVLAHIKPKSVEDLAVVLALLRPAKSHLIGSPRDVIDAQIWDKGHGGEYSFKRAHALAYATSIIVQANLKVAQGQAS